MKNVLRICLAWIVCVGCSTETPAPAPEAHETVLADTQENRLAQANRYLTTMPPQEMVSDMTKNMSQSLPEERRGEFVEVMTKHLDLVSLRKTMVESMVKHFTADELKALADFYSSTVGKAAMMKFGSYMGDVMPKLQEDVMKAFALYMEKSGVN
jgi:hypothetical protein